ncbi:hypothetical protein M0R45_014557 [Rubus argutus]|uniref:DNA topoisomerase n=1 Tax=Rubus argutus TaxID=59490 RepID=A0AAW1XMY3_RUBAR
MIIPSRAACLLTHTKPLGLEFREGQSRYNKTHKLNYSISVHPCQMLFTSVIGHLRELKFEDGYRKWQSYNPVLLFQPHVRKFVLEGYRLSLTRGLEPNLEFVNRKDSGHVAYGCDQKLVVNLS